MKFRRIIFFFLFCYVQGRCQKYNFVNWTVEDGLVQSQASFICQDNYRQLWIGTEGGISRFDGKKFTAYTVQDGLVANHINTMHCDSKGNIWIGTNYGISVYNGRSYRSIKPLETAVNNVTHLTGTANGDIYTIDNFNLVRIRNSVAEKLDVCGDTTAKITSLYRSNDDQIVAAVYRRGIYAFIRNN